MSGPSLKSLKKQAYRVKHRERYSRSTFISEYVQKKYTAIYDEANQFFQELHLLHPKKTKLSTSIEYKMWEESLKKDVATTQDSVTSDFNINIELMNAEEVQDVATTQDSVTSDFNINIELMNAEEVQLKKDTIIFEEIHPSLIEEIDPKIVDEIIQELNQTPIANDIFDNNGMFDDDEEMNEFINTAIQDDLNQMTELEKELLKY